MIAKEFAETRDRGVRMARPTSPLLTDAELRLMKVLWDRGPLTTAEIVSALAGEVTLAESTVRTMMGILKEKGYVAVEARGRANAFHARVGRGEVRASAVRHVLSRFFDGSAAELVLNLLKSDDLDERELARVKRMLEEEGR